MSISKRGSSTPVGDNAPLGDNASVGDLFNRFEVGNGTPADVVGNSGIKIGSSTLADDVGNPGPEIGISAPTTDDVVPADSAPAGDSTSFGDAGGGSGAGTWEWVTHATVVEGCGCAACQALVAAKSGDDDTSSKGVDPTASNPESGPIGQLLTIGTNPDGSRFFSGNRNVDAILIGAKWGTQNLTFSFPTSGTNYNGIGLDPNGVNLYHIDLGSNQQAAARAAFAMISAATGLTFTEITETDAVHANIRISQTADQDAGSAYGGFPSDFRGVSGDIWFGRTSQPYYDLAFKGTWGFSTMLHEIGHTMGLKHGHQDYTNLDLSSFFGTSPRFGSQSLTPDRDGQAWSLMTYTPAPFTNTGFAGEKVNQPQSYMQYDLAALQYMYGANYTTNAGDSVYTFSQTTGEMFIDGVGQGAPSGNKIFLTVWDGGGNDTIDASNYANGVTIDLRPGEFSTFDPAQLANNLFFQNLVNLAPGNIAMSLLYNNDVRSLIENATGGTGNDIFVGNIANNVLDGGAGSDTVIFTNTTGVNVTLNDTNTDVIVSHDGETDTLRSIENIQGTIGNDILVGNSQDNTLSGGAGGTDNLSGGDGNDRLIGGGFTTVNNAIITKPQATSNLSTATAINPQTSNGYTLVSDSNITNSTTIPHATINATATGGGLEYYRLDVTAGATATFDIDFSSIDTWLELVDSTGTVILANNDDSFTDPGSSTGNSFLSFTFVTAGTYYIRVGRWTQPGDPVAQPLTAGTTYTLHVSLSSATVNAAPFTATNTSSATLDGGEGNDFLQGTLGDDTLTGGNANDTASFATAFSNGATGVTVDLNTQGVAQNTVAAGSDTLSGIENLVGSQYNDTLTGDGNDNIIEGGLGNDTLAGGLGNDTASYAGATAGVTASLALQGAAQNTVNAGSDTLSGFENLLGSGFNDSLTGDSNVNILTGGAGNDTLNPGANAGGIVDLLDGGIGTDTASFAGNAAGVTATLNGATDATATVGGLAIATLRGIENLTGSSNADILTGDLNANVIEGGLGDDILDGGLGVDTLAFSGSTAVTVNLATLTAQSTGWGSDTIANFENVRTGSGADNVTGDGNDNIFFDGGGTDTYNGAAGLDTVDYTNIVAALTVNLTLAGAQAASTGGDILSNIENVTGSLTAANTLTGSTLANRLTGGAAADLIIGGSGVDTILGGAGADLLLGGNGTGTDDGTADTVEGGAGGDFVSGGQGNDILRGGDGDDTLVGGAGNNLGQFFTGVDGGDDTYEGGDGGADVAIMVYDTRLGVGASTVGIAFDLGNFAGNSAITFNGVNVGSLTSVERVTFRGTTVDDAVKGGGSLDSLTGGAGNDVLDGWIGNDLLSGGLGNDTLIGGEGLDTVTYVNSTAGVNVDLRIDGVAQNTGGEGTDTLIGIEYLTGSAFGDTLRGNDEFNLIIDTGVSGPAGQTDSLFGYGGKDSIHVTRAAAAVATNINMDGGDGDDLIELRGGTLSVALAANLSGLSASGTGANVTYLVAGATSNDRNLDVVTVDGGAGSDRIILTGVASATINAGSGADLVSISMRGATSVNNYQITLGSGADIIQLGVGVNAAASTDVAVTARTNRVADFERGDAGDKFEMTSFLNFGLTGYTANSNAFASGHLRVTQSGSDLVVQIDRDAGGATNSFVTVFAISNGYTGGFTAFNFDGFIGNLTLTGIGALDETITGATGNDVLSGGDGNDLLIGLAGTDTLNGGNGEDVLRGGTGNDALNGGAGNDTADYAGPRSGYNFTYATDPATGRVTGFSSVTDTNAGNGDEGADTLTSIEKLTFSDQTIDLTQPVQLFDASNNLVGTFGTIQAAIDAASNGYTVRAAAGTYNENLNVNKDITIEGPNVGIAGSGARGAEATIDGLVSIVADGVTLNGLKITGAPLFGQDITAIFVNNDNATLTNLILDGPDNGYGIQTTYNGGVTGLILSNSLVTDWGAGTYFNPTTGFTATGNSFTGNGNDILGDGWVAGSFIDNNSFNDSVGSHIGYGTYLSVEDMRDFVGTNNIFTGTGSRAVGIFAYGDGTPGGQDVTGTEYADGFFGSEFIAGSGNDSTFHGLGGNDSMSGGAGNDTFQGGSGIDTAAFNGTAIIAETATGWTVTTGTDGTDTLENVEIVDDSAPGKILLVQNGGYATIQEAIDAAADGDTILVAAGTYVETLNVNKDVTILGANHGVDGTAVRGAETVIDGQITINAAGATVDGVKIVGAAPGSLYNTAVEVKADNFTLANSVLDGTSDIAIFVGLVSGVDIGRNLIRGYSIGAYVAGGNTSGSIHDNRFQGDGGPITGLGNGVNSESSHVAIASNVFDGIYSGSLNIFPFGPDSVDLNTYITGNTISNTPVARPVQIMPTNLTHNIIGTDHNEAFDGETAALYGVTGAFSFDGRGGDDKAWGGEEGDTLAGGTGIDELFGNGGNDNLSGGDQNDTLHGGAGDDTADGGNNNDIVNGDLGNDVLAGGAGIDTLNGGDDNDSLDGGSGNDTLNGGEGNDTMHGGAGNDNLNGGNGTDTAVYDNHRGDYSIGMITGAGGRIVGFSSVSDNEPTNGNEGADALTSVERVQFSNRTLDATQPVQLFDQTNQLVGTFNTIQAAIDSAQDNYTIRVAAGTFDEDLVIDVGVRILGARTTAVTGRDSANGVGETTIVGHAKVTAEDNVTLTGLRFLNDGSTTGGGASNPTLQFLTGGGAAGHVVSNSIFWSSVVGGANGVDDRAISAPAIPDGQLTFTGNLISGSSQGLFSTASWGRGIWIDGGGVALSASGNIVEWTRSGLVLDGAGGSVYFVSGNILRNLGTAFSIATTENGLVESGNTFQNVGDEYNFRNLSENVTFDAGLSGNTLTPVGTSNDVVVILGGSGNDTLTGTSGADYIDANNRPGNLTVADTDTLNGGGGNDILLGRFGADTLNGGTGEDILDGGDGNDILNGNADNDSLIGGAGEDSLNGGAGDDSLDGGSGVDTAVVGSGAVYTPTGTGWTVTSSDGTDTLINVEVVDSGPGPNTLLVGSGGFATIQAAVNAAQDGDTILVAAGVYVEQVTVNNLDNLTIVAVDGAQVTIKAPADLVETGRSSSDREIHAVLTAKDSLNLTVQNIDIDGDGRGNTVDEGGGAGQANFYGVFYRNSSGSLFDVDITGVRDPYPGGTAAGGQPLVSGVQRGVGLVVDNDALLAFTMIGGSISDFQKNATVFNRADLNIAGVTITGGGAQTINAQNGIQVSNSTGTIAANTINGLGYAGTANAYSGAILSSGNTNLTIAGNAITGANIDSPAARVVGIWVYQTGAPNSGGAIVGNSISHVDEGIDVTGDITPDGIQIENNSISNVDGSDNDPVGVYFAPNPALVTAHDVDGSDVDDTLSGGAGNDTLSGLDGDDVLTGNGGDDILNGDGGGDDVAVYSGPRAGYAVTGVADGGGRITSFSTVDDTNAGNGDEGTDTLTGVERLQFGDVTLDLTDPVQLFDAGGQLVGTFDTIQAAVNAASSGYTISVAAGTYAEIVTVDEDVTILGPNAGIAGTGTRVGEAVVDGFYMHSAGATLNGLTILGGGTIAGNPAGIYVDVDGVTLTNLIVEGDGTATPGILTPYNGGVTGLVLSNSLVTGWAQGTYFNPTTGFTASGNSFDGNGNAIVGDDWDDATLIENNSFTNSVGSHIGYGVLDTVDDVGAYFGTGNTFGGTNRPTSIFAYGDGTPASQTVYGTELSNLIRGETAGETYNFHGRGGDDRLVGNDGNDSLDGGTGNDTMVGGAGTDTVILADSTFSISPVADADPSTPGNQAGWTITTASEGTDSISGVEIIDSGAAGKILLVGNGGFTTIQAAVDAASDGDTIFVAAGTYTELVTVNKDVTIVGSNAGIAADDPRNPEVVVDGGFHMNAAGATLDGLTVLGGGNLGGNPAGIYVDADDVTLTNLIVQGDGSAGTGILTPYNGGVSGLVLSNSRIDDWTNGTYFNPTTQFTATDNSFDGNGVALTGDDWDDGTLISGNSFTNSSFGHVGYGVLDAVEDVGAFFGTGNSFDPSGGRIGIFAYGTDQDITGTQFGDYFADTVAGSDGSFHGEGGNDYIDAGSGNDSLEGGTGDDILVGGSGTDTASFADPVTLADLTFVADADPETAGDQPGWIVTTATEGTDRLVGIEIVDGGGSNILLVGNGGFTTIQAAIDASSDGDTILVAAGLYDEDLDVHVGVTILGAQAGVAVAGRDSAGGTGETTIVGHAVVTASANVTLDGLRFLNDTSTTAPTVSILTGGATGHVITDSIFWSTIAGGANGVDDRAISISPIADGLITITDNLISGTSQGQFGTASWGRGIWFDGGGVDLVVTGNTIEWTRSGLNLDMSGNSTANVSDNVFRGLGTGIAVGIDADGLTVGSNDLERVGTEFSFRNLTTGVTFNAGAAIGVLTTVGDSNDLVVVLGGSGNDDLTGTGGADVLDGNNSPTDPNAADTDVLNGLGGNDSLFGRGGNDMLDGGTGDDAMTGGTGNDVYIVDSAGDSATEAAGEGTDEVRTALATYTLAAALENLTGLGNVNQTLNGNSSDNIIDGGLGADAMTGGAGNDTYVVDNGGDTVTELAGEGTDEIRTNLATYSLAALVNLENLTGTNAAGQTLTGNGSANVVTGAGGDDIIDGGTGADTMRGGGGNDLYFVEIAGDVVTENVGEGIDEVRTGLAAYVLAANVENLTATSNVNHDFRGNSGNNVITGGSGSDLLRLYDGGDDTVLAGAGSDNIFFIGSLTSADIVNGGADVDTLILQGNYAGGLTLTANVTLIENISILGGGNTNFGDPGTNLYDYVLTTHDANFAAGLQPRINGAALLAGEDFTFNGSAETNANFVVYGGKGIDTLTGGFGNDIFIFGEDRFVPGDTVNGGPGGYDGIFLRGNYTIDFNAPGYFGLLTSIENMSLTSITDERYARGGDPAGFDYNITLADNQLLAGVELTVSGVSLQTYETMIVDGSQETDGHFRLFAGRANDILKGGANNDLLLGNLGADQLTGGGGADTFRYDSTADSNAASMDQILDFTPGTDKIELTRTDANALVAGDQAFTWIGSNAFTNTAGQLRAVQQGGNWILEGDTNGDGVADLVIALSLQGPTPLSASDFFL